MATIKRVFIVGGTGFLGYHAIQEFYAHGWEVTALGLPATYPKKKHDIASSHPIYPATVNLCLKDLNVLPDEELTTLMRDHVALVFAAGMDDRTLPKNPAYPKFYKANVEILARLMNLAKKSGVKRIVVLGSYFAHFNRVWPEMKLAGFHPYIRSRIEQEKTATSMPGLDGIVLEFPYIFGSVPFRGWKPLWTPLIKYLRAFRTILFMKGGTACISALTAGRAIFAAVERGEAGRCYPIGQENLTWSQMLTRLARADNRRIKVVTMPSWIIKVGMLAGWLIQKLQGKEGGLNLRHFSQLQTAETFIDPLPSRKALCYQNGDLDEAFLQTVRAFNS